MGGNGELADVVPAFMKHCHQRDWTQANQPLQFRMNGDGSGEV